MIVPFYLRIWMLIWITDRHECGQYVDQVNESRVQLESYVMDLQNEIQDRTILIQLLEESELFYEVQNSEANIVGTVSNMMKISLHCIVLYLYIYIALLARDVPGSIFYRVLSTGY